MKLEYCMKSYIENACMPELWHVLMEEFHYETCSKQMWDSTYIGTSVVQGSYKYCMLSDWALHNLHVWIWGLPRLHSWDKISLSYHTINWFSIIHVQSVIASGSQHVHTAFGMPNDKLPGQLQLVYTIVWSHAAWHTCYYILGQYHVIVQGYGSILTWLGMDY